MKIIHFPPIMIGSIDDLEVAFSIKIKISMDIFSSSGFMIKGFPITAFLRINFER